MHIILVEDDAQLGTAIKRALERLAYTVTWLRNGREALLGRKASPQHVLVGLELVGNEPASHGDGVYVGRSQVGVVTSATRSPILAKNIALCRMSVQHSELGSEVLVGKLDGQQKRIPATVVRFPFYDPDKIRPRS